MIGHVMDALSLPKFLQSTLDAGEEFVDFGVGDDERGRYGDEVAYASHDGAFLADMRGGGDAERGGGSDCLAPAFGEEFDGADEHVAPDFSHGGMLCKGVEFFLKVGSHIIADTLHQAEVLDCFQVG